MTVKRETDCENDSPSKKTKHNTTIESPAKWTDEELKLLCSLKLEGHTFKELTAHFPGRTMRALQMAMHRRGKEVFEEFTPEIDAALKYEIENFQRNMWVHIGRSLGRTPAGCKKRAAEKNLFK